MTHVPSIGAYETIRVLGEGGMGVVYLARDPAIGRLVAIKLLRAGLDSPALRARLGQEARAAGRLSHPNIVTIFHVDEEGGRPYIVMEYVEGQTLAALIRDGVPLPLSRRLLMLERVCAGLACAHDAGLVHRDVKPANIMVDAAGEPKLLDFGLAKLPDASVALTGEHAVLGTLSYMSPEQLSNGRIDHRSDLFALAAVSFELLTARRAFPGDARQVIGSILTGSPASLFEGVAIDRELAAVIARGLERNPDRRFQSARDLAATLGRVRAQLGDDSECSSLSRPASAAPRRSIKAVAALSAAVVGVGLLYQGMRGDVLPHDAVSASLVDGSSTPSAVVTPAPARGAAASGTQRAPIAPPVVSDRRPRPAAAPSGAPPAASPVAPVAESFEPEPAASTVRVPVGTVLTVSIETPLDSRRTGPGEPFAGVVDDPVMAEGRELVPAGTRVEGRVERSGVAAGRPFMELSLTALSLAAGRLPIRTGFYRAVAPSVASGPDFVAILIGAAAGAAIGGAVGGGNGAMAGAAIGGAGATTVGRMSAPAEYHLGERLPFRTAEPVHIDTASSRSAK